MAAQQQRDWLEVYADEYRQRGLYIVAANFDPRTGMIHVRLKAGMTISFSKERSQTLARATDEQLSEVEVSPAGWSVDFPRIDDGISLMGLLSGVFGNERWEREWAASHEELAAA